MPLRTVAKRAGKFYMVAVEPSTADLDDGRLRVSVTHLYGLERYLQWC